MTQYTISVNDNSSNVQIQFLNSGSNVGYIDDVSIGYTILTPSFVSGYNAKPITGQSTTSSDVTGLSPNTTYYYRVRAKSANSTSANSNTVTAFTAFANGTTNASTLPDCATCEIVVNNGGELNVNATKTYNKVTVKAGGKLTLASGSALTAPITIESDATNGTGTYVDENAGTGLPAITGTVNQAVTTGRYWYVASPISSADYSVLGASVYYYDAAATPSAYATTTALSPGVGYAVSPSVTNFVFSGTLNNGAQNAKIAYNGNTSDAFRGYNLIGNPYPSALNWNNVWANTANQSTVKSTIWFNANGTFETYNASGSVGVPSDVKGYIPPMQGFWVLATDAASSTTSSNKTLALDNTMRSHGPATGSNPLRAPQSAASENQLIRLQATNGIATDEMVLYFNSQAADTYDNYDSRKMMSSNAAQIYTLLDGMPIVINGMNTIPYNAEIPVAFKTVSAGEHTIKATEFSNFTSGESLLLTDKTLNRVTDLSSSDYTFTSSVGTDVNRFALTIQRVSTSVAGNNTQNSLQVVQSAGRIQILLPSFESGAVAYIYNNIGQITAKSNITGTVTTMSQNLPAGVYIVKVMTGTDELTEKIIVK